MKISNLIFIPLGFFFSIGAMFANPGVTQETNTSYFSKAPRLLGASTTFNSVRATSAKYYFNIALPPEAQTNLQQVTIAQRQGQETIDFRLEDTVAYIGTNRRKENQITIADVTQNTDTGEITILLEKPISPGTTFTVGLKPKRNPFYDGVYLFGVTAFPQGNNPQGLYLGSGRLHFYRGSDGFFRH